MNVELWPRSSVCLFRIFGIVGTVFGPDIGHVVGHVSGSVVWRVARVYLRLLLHVRDQIHDVLVLQLRPLLDHLTRETIFCVAAIK